MYRYYIYRHSLGVIHFVRPTQKELVNLSTQKKKKKTVEIGYWVC